MALARREGGDVDSMRALIVEDNHDLRGILRDSLRALGWQVATARDGADAWLLLHNGGGLPDVVLTDIVMPEMDGLTLIERVGQRFPELPIVVLSGNADTIDRKRARALGACAVHRKPMTPYELADALREAVDASRAAQVGRDEAGRLAGGNEPQLVGGAGGSDV